MLIYLKKSISISWDKHNGMFPWDSRFRPNAYTLEKNCKISWDKCNSNVSMMQPNVHQNMKDMWKCYLLLQADSLWCQSDSGIGLAWWQSTQTVRRETEVQVHYSLSFCSKAKVYGHLPSGLCPKREWNNKMAHVADHPNAEIIPEVTASC